MAPRARMAQPLRSSHRPARRSGLTSPDPVRLPTPTAAQAPRPPTRTPDKPQNRQRQAKHALKAPFDENSYTKSIGGLRLRRTTRRLSSTSGGGCS
jgi:hypothetical protein